ncbi:isochorismatase family protein, partial [Candidatus Dojkabacteria bacterium]|nr:isochorismatase family protein [Candidatus Dojkabacteria bacterium]
TAADAHFRGYKILIPDDAVVSSRPEDTKRSLEWLADYCAKVIPSDEIIEIIKKDLKGE